LQEGKAIDARADGVPDAPTQNRDETGVRLIF
jgi:hypothetical protein